MSAFMNASPFSGIKEAQQMGGSRRLEVGNYTLEVDAVRFFKSRKDKRPVFVVDLTVLESSNPAFKPKDRVGYTSKENAYPDYFLADIKGFIAAAADMKDDEIDEKVADNAVSEEQPLRGAKVRAVVSPGKPRDDGKEPFPVVRFMPAT